jgi:hypothetical protein
MAAVQDALRLYLINSPVVRAETLRFKKEGVFSVVSISNFFGWNFFTLSSSLISNFLIYVLLLR